MEAEQPPKPEITQEQVEMILSGFARDNIFGKLRAAQTENGSFFDPETGFVTEEDESETGNVLDQYRDALGARLEEAIQTYQRNENDIAKMLAVLEPNSDQRRILLAYWQTKEPTPWIITSQKIMSRQTYKDEDFPNVSDVFSVLEHLK